MSQSNYRKPKVSSRVSRGDPRSNNKSDRPPKYSNNEEDRVFGYRASKAIFSKRPNDIIKVFLNEKRRNENQDLVSWCVQNKKVFRVVQDVELSRITKSEHHEGIAITAKSRRRQSIETMIVDLKKKDRSIVALLLGVGNPHNIGAILRTAAFFGTDAVVIEEKMSLDGVTARVAEGGLEYLSLAKAKDVLRSIEQFKEAGFRIVATSPHAKEDVYSSKLPKRALILFGAEGLGLSEEILKSADLLLAIPGSGHVESLNVSCSAAVVLGEFAKSLHL